MQRVGNRGFSLLELSVSIGIVTLLITGAVVLLSVGADSSRRTETNAKLMMLKRAIVGDPRIVTKESRTDFGYIGDMGSLPPALTDLWIKGSKPAYAYDNVKKTGAGWAGPYVQVGPAEFFNELALDAWGNPIQYTVATGTSSVTGQEYRAKLFSMGADATTGGGDDVTIEIYTTEMLSTLVSYVRDSSGNPMANIPVRMNYSSAGALTSATTSTTTDGSYSFSQVPIGNRSISIEPKLVYSEGSGVTIGGDRNNIEFVMISYTCGTITSITTTYDVTAFYSQARVGNNTLYTSPGTNLAASGELATFTSNSPYNINWGSCGAGTGLSQTLPVRIQSAFTQVPDQDIGAGASLGKNFRFRINGFETLENGSGQEVDMTGISVTVLFSNGSTATFSPVQN